MTNGFALNHDKNLKIYFFCVKRQAKNDFLKDVESTVVSCSWNENSQWSDVNHIWHVWSLDDCLPSLYV